MKTIFVLFIKGQFCVTSLNQIAAFRNYFKKTYFPLSYPKRRLWPQVIYEYKINHFKLRWSLKVNFLKVCKLSLRSFLFLVVKVDFPRGYGHQGYKSSFLWKLQKFEKGWYGNCNSHFKTVKVHLTIIFTNIYEYIDEIFQTEYIHELICSQIHTKIRCRLILSYLNLILLEKISKKVDLETVLTLPKHSLMGLALNWKKCTT